MTRSSLLPACALLALVSAPALAQDDPTEPGLSSLAELYLNSAHHRMASQILPQCRHTKVSPIVTATEIAGPNLPDEFAAMDVMRCDTAFARVVKAVRQLATTIDRLDCHPAQRSEAHR